MIFTNVIAGLLVGILFWTGEAVAGAIIIAGLHIAYAVRTRTPHHHPAPPRQDDGGEPHNITMGERE